MQGRTSRWLLAKRCLQAPPQRRRVSRHRASPCGSEHQPFERRHVAGPWGSGSGESGAQVAGERCRVDDRGRRVFRYARPTAVRSRAGASGPVPKAVPARTPGRASAHGRTARWSVTGACSSVDRASGFGPLGRGFESCRARQFTTFHGFGEPQREPVGVRVGRQARAHEGLARHRDSLVDPGDEVRGLGPDRRAHRDDRFLRGSWARPRRSEGSDPPPGARAFVVASGSTR